MEAAITLAKRGHHVTLWEREKRLGGQLALASVPPHKSEVAQLSNYLASQLNKSGVSISLGTEATVALIEEMKPDAVVVATGIRPILPRIPGIDNAKVVLSSDVLAGKTVVGENVAIIGGELVGCETADYLVDKGKYVTVMRRGETFATKVNSLARDNLLARLKRKGVTLMPRVKYDEITDKGLTITKDGEKQTIPADTIVVAAGAAPEVSLVEALQERGLTVHAIADCVSPGNIADALRDGAQVGREI